MLQIGRIPRLARPKPRDNLASVPHRVYNCTHALRTRAHSPRARTDAALFESLARIIIAIADGRPEVFPMARRALPAAPARDRGKSDPCVR